MSYEVEALPPCEHVRLLARFEADRDVPTARAPLAASLTSSYYRGNLQQSNLDTSASACSKKLLLSQSVHLARNARLQVPMLLQGQHSEAAPPAPHRSTDTRSSTLHCTCADTNPLLLLVTVLSDRPGSARPTLVELRLCCSALLLVAGPGEVLDRLRDAAPMLRETAPGRSGNGSSNSGMRCGA